MDKQSRVVFLTQVVTHYRVPFHERLRQNLARAGIRYDIISGVPRGDELKKADTIDLDWVTRIPEWHFGLGRRKILFHPVSKHITDADLVVIMQENKHLYNYILQLRPKGRRPIVAMMGHGRNFQSRARNSISERWKRFWATRVDWWFAYTDESRRHIASTGYPLDRITVFNNSVDTSRILSQQQYVTKDRLAERRVELDLRGDNVGIFVGGLYADKRIDFLIQSADLIRKAVLDYELIVVGDGPDIDKVVLAAKSRPWIKVTGAKFGSDKVELMMLGKIFTMPGLVGLAILDAGVIGLPTVTTAFPWHSPEIAYLSPNESGIIVSDWESPEAYATAVAQLLIDPLRLQSMGEAARASSARFSIEAMADKFSDGIQEALAAGVR